MYRLEQVPLLGLDSGLMQANSLWLLNAGQGTHSLRVIVPVSSCGWNDYYQRTIFDSGALKAQGKQLRIAIDQEYKRLKSDQRVRANDINGVDVGPTIREFVPIGTSLDDVVVILHAAGFEVRRTPLGGESRPSADAIIASIEPLERGFLWAYHSSIKVMVRSGSNGDAGEIVAAVKFPMS
jgi:hypothetical protein